MGTSATPPNFFTAVVLVVFDGFRPYDRERATVMLRDMYLICWAAITHRRRRQWQAKRAPMGTSETVHCRAHPPEHVSAVFSLQWEAQCHNGWACAHAPPNESRRPLKHSLSRGGGKVSYLRVAEHGEAAVKTEAKPRARRSFSREHGQSVRIRYVSQKGGGGRSVGRPILY
jgi:hypothetical protein